jgi:acyl-CoA synthetase (AMP-forming)/AMP-acid ligase II/acyl carrier protein
MLKQRLMGYLLSSIWMVGKLLIRLRYRLHIKGLDQIKGLNPGKGTLFLPNHPAQIDPVIIYLLLRTQFRPRPLVIDYFFHLPGLEPLMRFAKALPIPSLDVSANKWKLHQVEKLFGQVAEGLEEGENFLIYPSGRLKLTAEEIIGGASFVYDLMQSCPEANVVLVRITGLWGSIFSRACTGEVPDLKQNLIRGMKIILKNFIFFTPKRDITIEFSTAPADFPREGTRKQFNEYLEKWYNRYPNPGPEPLKLVSFSFWRREVPKIAMPKQEPTQHDIAIPAKMREEIYQQIAKLSQQSLDRIHPSSHLSIDLGMDSLDVAQLYVFLDERYDIVGITPGELHTVSDVLKAAVGAKEPAKKHEKGMPARKKWPEEPKRPPVLLPEGKTLQEAFLRLCDRMDSYVCCTDLTSGMLTYKRAKIAVLILAAKIKKLPGKEIGILIPSSVGGYLAILATLIAGKVPVMLNWTAGVRSLNSCAELTSLKAVITSQKFLENLEGGDVGDIIDRLIFLEDLKRSVTLGNKIAGLYKSRMKANTLLRILGLKRVNETDPTVILFTSGSEAQPKAVPLSHKNILSNQKAAMSCIPLAPNDILYSILPPFHSFGFTVTGLLPLLSGLKVCFSPDPTDSHKLAKEIEHWKVSLFCAAPSFIKMLFQVADKKQLQSVRLFVSGAEKAPQDIFDYMRSLSSNPQIIEGYGITECAPMVSMTRPALPHIGVGLPLPGIEICIINPETGERLPSNQEGEICIAGDNVFSGYLGSSANPFITLDGKKWYRSGDRGHIDPQTKSIILSGRLKRFVKIGGEMISLGGLEEEILSLVREKKWNHLKPNTGPHLAVSVVEPENEKPSIVLFTTFELNRDDVNIALKERGYGRIVKIGQIKRVKEIPLTGTGKTHYRLLDEQKGK